MKRPTLDMSRFVIAAPDVEAFEHYVHLTSKLIKRPYIQTAKLMETWTLEKIIRRYEECTKHAGTPPDGVSSGEWSAILWWSKRKRESRPSV